MSSAKKARRRLFRRYMIGTDDWQMVHGNLMTILMIFFLVMFSQSYIKKATDFEKVMSQLQSEFGGSADKTKMEQAQYRETEKKVVEKIGASEGLKKFTKVETDREKIRIIFPDPVIFSPGSDELKIDTLWILSQIADNLKLLPDSEIVIEGHTDSDPLSSTNKFSSNWELSLARSLSIVHYLTEVEAMNPGRFIPIGYGENRPLFPNDTKEHKAQNRRIEISIIKKG